MLALVADTHTSIWYFQDQGRLSTNALAALDQATAASNSIGLPTIAIVELCYLVDKGRLPESALLRVLTEIRREDSVLSVVSLDSEIARAVREIPRELVPDMPDRIIAATALHLGLPLVTRDAKTRSANITTIW